MESLEITWKTVLAYVAISNGREERIVGKINKSIGRLVLHNKEDWDSSLFAALQGYRRSPLSSRIYPFELLYEVKPRLMLSDQNPLLHIKRLKSGVLRSFPSWEFKTIVWKFM